MNKYDDIQLPKGITLHRGKLRIAFRPAGFKNQVKRVLDMAVTKSNIKVAEIKLNAIRHEIMLGTFDIGKHFPNDPLCRKQGYTVTQMLDGYLADLKNRGVKRSTLRQRGFAIDLLKRCAGQFDIRHAERADILELRKTIKNAKSLSRGRTNKTRSNAEVNKLIAMLKRSADIAVEHHLLESNPFITLRPLPTTKQTAKNTEASEEKVRVLTIEQATAIIAELPEGFARNIIQFCFWSGARHGEALALEKRDLDLPYVTIRRTLTLNSGMTQTPKTGAARRILLPRLAVEAIEAQLPLAKKDRIFETAGKHRSLSTNSMPRIAWARALKKLNIDFVTPYVTRHSFVSWMLMAGESEWKIAQHVGHKNTQMIQRTYGHFIPKSGQKWSLDDPSNF
ncbi:Arm DNA-binding domain-containing protein [Shewanella gaetbuli]|uniref:Tyrosine-type recombinase/integrase n=1 Tax=Shewanella gaetbuli TaxID=220752 RepID=A0A9X2CLT4_9GAMM|nr:DUF3596 domain-containing protein [Shewanella gaetbuli]MCL1142940.1 tyrosine-type recombinase/integrase [Shewanella gaetbuli]